MHVVTSYKAPTLRSWRETSWIAWRFSEHQNMLFWLLTFQFNVNDASSKKNSNFLISFSSSLETIAKNFFDILYVVALHGSISAGQSLQNFHWLFFFIMHALQNIEMSIFVQLNTFYSNPQITCIAWLMNDFWGPWHRLQWWEQTNEWAAAPTNIENTVLYGWWHVKSNSL